MTTNFGVEDRGCLPVMAANPQLQTQSKQLLFGPGTGTLSITSLQKDYGAYIDLLCSTSGTCCSTSFCNSSRMLSASQNGLTFYLSVLSLLGFFMSI